MNGQTIFQRLLWCGSKLQVKKTIVGKIVTQRREKTHRAIQLSCDWKLSVPGQSETDY